MIVKKEKDWFKVKRYPHIGLPLNPHDRFKWIEKYVTSPESIAKHRFLPFIHKTAKVKKYRKVYNSTDGKVSSEFKIGNKPLRKPEIKTRELFYASHLDSLIFSYYAKLLSDKYEIILKDIEYNLDSVVSAYRSIPINPLNINGSNKCNIDFANDAFKSIIDFLHDEFAVIAFDISSFFDNLDHALLRKVWGEVLKEDKLPTDHFNVFKNITRFSHVDIVDIFEEFKTKIYTRKTSKLGHVLEIKQKGIEKIKFLRNQNAIAFCNKDEFLKVKGKLLQPSKTKKLKDGSTVNRNFGIPQGSPISSVLANIYLLHFDKIINDYLYEIGVYRRYSDDMIVICPTSKKDELIALVYKEIKNYKLEIQPKKTQIFHFKKENGKLICGQQFENEINWHKNLIYLGFEFDGSNVRIKSASLSGYYRKMKRAVRRAKHHSLKLYYKKPGELFKKRLLKKYTYRGAKRTRKYLWDKNENIFKASDSYNWGNFLSYSNKAANIMVTNKIKQQTKRHWNIFNKLIK
jgi:hypothetical protein